MKQQQWQVRRTTVRLANGQQRWDQAYQLLLRWAQTDQPGPTVAELVHSQEVPRACSRLRSRLNHSPSAAADD